MSRPQPRRPGPSGVQELATGLGRPSSPLVLWESGLSSFSGPGIGSSKTILSSSSPMGRLRDSTLTSERRACRIQLVPLALKSDEVESSVLGLPRRNHCACGGDGLLGPRHSCSMKSAGPFGVRDPGKKVPRERPPGEDRPPGPAPKIKDPGVSAPRKPPPPRPARNPTRENG